MKKLTITATIAINFLFPALIFAQMNIDANPYPVNSLARNFYNNLNDGQKFLVVFRDEIRKNIECAKKAQDVFDTAVSENNLEKKGIDSISLQMECVQAIAILKTSEAPISPSQVATLNESKKKIISEIINRAAADLNALEHEYRPVPGGDTALTAAMEAIDGILKDHLLGVDKSGNLVKYDGSGVIVEYELPENYLMQKGDIYRPVPFFAQAPGGGWYDTCQGTACEETTLIQAAMWLEGVDYRDPYGIYGDEDMLQRYALRQILSLCDYQYKNTESHLYHDTSIRDTALLWRNYFKKDAKIIENPTANKLKRGIDAGHIYVIPINGQRILTSLPYSDPAKLPAHSILLVGYNDDRDEFIVNDPGTWRGGGWRFNQSDLMAAVRDYPSGAEVPITKEEKRVLELPSRLLLPSYTPT